MEYNSSEFGYGFAPINSYPYPYPTNDMQFFVLLIIGLIVFAIIAYIVYRYWPKNNQEETSV